MGILYELVTVIRELTPIYHWELGESFPGKMADAMVDKPRSLSRETCLNAVRRRLFQATSNWLYVLDLQNFWMDSAGLFCVWILCGSGNKQRQRIFLIQIYSYEGKYGVKAAYGLQIIWENIKEKRGGTK